MPQPLDTSSVNEPAVIDFLEEQVLRDRAPEEAFGELLFLNQLRVQGEVLSNATAGGIAAVGEQWLRERVGDERLAAARALAEEYAALLKERVDLKDPYAMFAPEAAWREWRSQHHD